MAKQSKPKKTTAKKSRKKLKLSPIENELLGYCKDHQPVLLYGDDKIGREDLLRSIHKSTERACKRINLAFFDSSQIYKLLAFQYRGNPIEATPFDYLDEDIFPYEEGCFYCCDGILFLDNLECNEENKSIYHELAAHIHEGHTSYKWLVVYTTNKPDDLPLYFRKQFELVPLDGEKAIVVPFVNGAVQKAKKISGITKKRGRKPKNPMYDEFMQIAGYILKDIKNYSVGGYVKKVKNEIERKGLKKKKINKNTSQEEEVLIYTDKTIRTYICNHPEYKKIQKRKNKCKNV